MDEREWILCPVCGNKTRNKIRGDTELKNFIHLNIFLQNIPQKVRIVPIGLQNRRVMFIIM